MNLPGAQENMPEKKEQYKVFEALDAYFEVVMKGLSGLVDGDHYFETFAEDAVFESVSGLAYDHPRPDQFRGESRWLWQIHQGSRRRRSGCPSV
jgi:hypothetical protein